MTYQKGMHLERVYDGKLDAKKKIEDRLNHSFVKIVLYE